MGKIEILDCTLRDGGYVNNWNFGVKDIDGIINGLLVANIDYVESGFLDNTKDTYNSNKSIYKNPMDIEYLIKDNYENKCTLMMLLHKYNIDELPICTNKKMKIIRLAFHKKDIDKVIYYSTKIKKNGYKLFLQPTIVMNYKDEEILKFLAKCNDIIQPQGVAIVDTLGQMKYNDVQKYTRLFDNTLDRNIKLIFHGHNNLQMAFSNAITFLSNVSLNRDIIIDTSLMGMGRNAGNVCTELITNYLNQFYHTNYDYCKILDIIDTYINDYKYKFEWGYSTSYILNAQKMIHPNYTKFFKENIKNLRLCDLNVLLDMIPKNETCDFNKRMASDILNKFLN